MGIGKERKTFIMLQKQNIFTRVPTYIHFLQLFYKYNYFQSILQKKFSIQ